MFVVRPAQAKDLEDIYELALAVGVGMTSLPADKLRLKARIERSIATFARRLPKSEQGFLFVLEDSEESKVVGVNAIEVAVGLQEPFYNYSVQHQVKTSEELGVHKQLDLLRLDYHYTGHSELCTLCITSQFRNKGKGLLLSKARLLFIASFPELFSSLIFAEMRGMVDQQGNSPFWEALGKHFFSISFSEAVRLSGSSLKRSIADLMPSYPIYVSLLPPSAQAVIGQVHSETLPAKSLLEKEGFKWCGAVDIFDAGPVLEAECTDIHTIRDNKLSCLAECHLSTKSDYLVANTCFKGFRAILVTADQQAVGGGLTAEQQRALAIAEIQPVRVVSLHPY